MVRTVAENTRIRPMKRLPSLALGPGAHLSLIVSVVFAVLWISHPREWHAISTILVLIFAYLGWSARWSRPPLPIQISRQGSRAVPVLAATTLGCVILLLLISRHFGFWDARVIRPYISPLSADFAPYWAVKVLTYLGCLAQQALLWWVVFPLCAAVTGTWLGTALLASSLFALLHLPNPLVMVASFALGLLSFFGYRRGMSVFLIAACHLILSLSFKLSFPDFLHFRLKAGANAVESLQKLRFISIHDLLRKTAPLSTAEYHRAQGGTDERYIEGLYRDVLGRAETMGGVETWAARGRNKRLQDVAINFVWEHVRTEQRSDAGDGPATRFATAPVSVGAGGQSR